MADISQITVGNTTYDVKDATARSAVATKQNAPSTATTLPSSGTALTANTEYRVSAAVGTYTFNFPASGDVYVRFTTGSTFTITFASGTTFLGEVPEFEAGVTYELMARDKIVACGVVVSE